MTGGLRHRKRQMGGQWPTLLSGAMSVLAGAQLILSASASHSKLITVGGYTIPGWTFFLLPALRPGRVRQAD